MDKGDAVKKFYFPIHLDSGNRGCEAIARGTIQILDILPQNYIGFSREIENDIITGIEKQISYINTKYDFLKKILIKVINKLKIKDKEKYVYYLRYSNFLKTINQDEICFITGGDMLCYGNNQVNYIVDYLHNKNITTVLWGCSFGEENYTSEKFKALSECSLITVRESLTYEYMTNKLGLKQVLLYPDPAFVLAPESINLPSYFENDCVGINLSNFVSGSVNATTCFEKNVINLNEKDLEKLIGSKYMQSRIGNSFSQVKKFLQMDKKVLFVGSTCQIAGLKSFLKRDYENLICVDFICLGTPSPKVWKDYLDTFFENELITAVNFKKRKKMTQSVQ